MTVAIETNDPLRQEDAVTLATMYAREEIIDMGERWRAAQEVVLDRLRIIAHEWPSRRRVEASCRIVPVCVNGPTMIDEELERLARVAEKVVQ